MMCKICNGSGNLFAIMPNLLTRRKEFKWFSCPGCAGVGTVFCDAPIKIQVKNRLGKNLVKTNRKLDNEEKLGVRNGVKMFVD